jgi:DNA primase
MSNWVDFTAIKRSVELAPLLRQYQVKLRRSGRDQYRGCCPIHGGHGREAFHANLSKNVFHCFSCGASGTVLDFVAAMDRCSLRAAALKLAHQTSVTHTEFVPLCSSERVTKKNKPLSPLGFTLCGVNSKHGYLTTRGIQTATAERFGIGFYAGPGILGGRLVIPIHDAGGDLVAYCGRAVDGSQPRYRFPSGFAKSEVVFNLHRAAATRPPAVVVVEGFFDCLRLHQAGVPAVVALMGAALYEAQQRVLLRQFRTFVLMLDGDTTGRHATDAIAAQLRPQAEVCLIHLPNGVQPDQLTPEAVREILQAHVIASTIR